MGEIRPVTSYNVMVAGEGLLLENRWVLRKEQNQDDAAVWSLDHSIEDGSY